MKVLWFQTLVTLDYATVDNVSTTTAALYEILSLSTACTRIPSGTSIRRNAFRIKSFAGEDALTCPSVLVASSPFFLDKRWWRWDSASTHLRRHEWHPCTYATAACNDA